MAVAQKVIKANVVALTKTKKDLLDQEYANLQHFLQKGEDLGVYSANKQQALRFYRKIKRDKEYPLSIRKDLIKIEHRDTCITEYWTRIPVKGRRGGVWVAIKSQPFRFEEYEICESKLSKKGEEYFLHVTVKKDVSPISCQNILAVDLGERVIATSVVSSIKKPKFYGREVRGIRRHYALLRKKLGERRLLRVINKIENTEKRKINDILHKISRDIVDQAKEYDAVIVIGDLKGIRSSAVNKGKRFNRIVSSMPYYKLTNYIEYKANWEGIRVIKINERGTSHTCSRCNSNGTRPYQGLFRCKSCGYRVNADYNGALNIIKRSEEYISLDGAMSELALNPVQQGSPHF